jgi:hypothetical protein
MENHKKSQGKRKSASVGTDRQKRSIGKKTTSRYLKLYDNSVYDRKTDRILSYDDLLSIIND